MSKIKYLIILFVSVLFVVACNKDDEEANEPITIDETPFTLEYGALPTPDLPADNPLTEQGVHLGKMLFYETMLSKDGTQACASCHRQPDGFSDSTRFSIGVEMLPGGRQAMPIF